MIKLNAIIQEGIDQEFGRGHKLLSLNHFSRNGNEVKLAIEKELLPFIAEEVHLLTPRTFHERDLVYLYVQELIDRLPGLKREGIIEAHLLSVLESLLLALDYLTHERFAYAPFTDEHRNEIKQIISTCFLDNKSACFSENANRPTLNKARILTSEDKVYCMDEREEDKRIYLAVLYSKSATEMEHFKKIAHWIGNITLKPNQSNVSFEEYQEGKTEHDLHEALLFYLNVVKNTFSWFINCTSWRVNELMGFDVMDINSKLGLKR